ncbi:MAG: 4-hydroxy-tetrahydrodipicolinate synthase [Bacteroidetes bacterium]|nr:4-hydroxy-tetrahydrodipicolinate synthase [Rhodothermia bacterium]MCS7155684.1 4-hydroxy-tetrahydrodipicolinate synthase [Bacteroidota bacterium]MCX7906543.1 4-hydroxy-tetrahydrodipicolinate synthase [Bacteroidota bacterium]MDW8137176.1 4-hydroxy-tetrahydrodipicolinate synthase [Bacteroidota bacterium]MDW8284954.1 4-hydroxy-tetrahydrodipicolinate synthase [Bacteroidota bacterium]
MFTGVATALATPFRDGSVDWVAWERLLEHQRSGGVSAVVVLGTTGEAPTVDKAERRALVESAVAHLKGRLPVVVGTGSYDTRQARALTEEAALMGADAALVVTPYYNKPPQEGLRRHFLAVAEVGLPVILYNVPGRTGVNLQPETVLRIAEEAPQVVGIKESAGSLAQMERLLALLRPARPEFRIYSGDDDLAFYAYLAGADGLISVLANVAPEQAQTLFRLVQEGQLRQAQTLQARLLPLARALFMEANPIPVKYALSLLGIGTEEVRLPLVPASAETRRAVGEALRALGLTPAPVSSPGQADDGQHHGL